MDSPQAQEKCSSSNKNHILEGREISEDQNTSSMTPTARKEYKSTCRIHKWRREKLLHDFLKKIKMNPEDAIEVLSRSTRKSARNLTREREVESFRFPERFFGQISNKDTAALTVFYQFSDRQIGFIRRYIGGIPKLESIREERWKFLESMPTIFGLNSEHDTWENFGNQRSTLISRKARKMKCFRFGLKDALYARFQEYLSIKSWPYPPDLFSIPDDEISRTVVVVLSIDSGTGTLKMMM